MVYELHPNVAVLKWVIQQKKAHINFFQSYISSSMISILKLSIKNIVKQAE